MTSGPGFGSNVADRILVAASSKIKTSTVQKKKLYVLLVIQ
jgi:hypothetical protein